ncbi:MAG: hypothetical protein VKP57_02470 [Candidatus Sericytochromatia bacterium]|nr:hypothetical protein [Candidatus Sericytochromatia bacterium]
MTPADDMASRSPALMLRIEMAKALLEICAIGKPAQEDHWGFYSYSDASPYFGGGIGAFVWGPDLNTIHAFIANVLPCDPPDRAEEGDLVLCATLNTIITRHGHDEEFLLEHLNRALQRHSVIEWIGPFHDLASGQGAFGRQLRHHFRLSLDETRDRSLPEPPVPETVPPITAEELTAFMGYLADYGG